MREIFAQLSYTGGKDAFDLIKQKLTECFEPQRNKCYEVYRFRESKQGETERLGRFMNSQEFSISFKSGLHAGQQMKLIPSC